MAVAMVRCGLGWGTGEIGEEHKEVQTLNYTINKSWDEMYSLGNRANNIAVILCGDG